MANNTERISFETTFGRYVAEGVLGEGGAGRVYRVIDESGAPFALKLLHGQGVTTETRRRFKNEVRFLQNTKHDNLVRVTDNGVQSDGKASSPFYVMEMYDESLRGLMRRGIGIAEVLPLFSQILDGVEAAHLKSVVHRDLKPENVLYRSATQRLAVADFGVARFSAEDLVTAVETKPNTRLANFQYAAPEQRVRNQPVDIPADIYALGLMLNEMFTGQVPHGTGYRKIADVDLELAWLDPIVESMLRQAPAERPASIDAVKREILYEQHNAVSLQKLSQIDQTVVKVGDVDDSIIANGLKIVDAQWDHGMLRLTLSQQVNPKWVEAMRNMGGYTSVMGKEPERFGFNGNVASIDAQEYEIKDVISHFRNWLPVATRVYEQRLKADAQREAAAQRESLQKRRKAEEESLRVAEMLKGVLGG